MPIEDMLRNLHKSLHLHSLKGNKAKGFNEMVLGEFLYDEEIKKFLGEDVIFHLNTVLADMRGLNLRNYVLHGLVKDTFFTLQTADLVIQAIIILSDFK